MEWNSTALMCVGRLRLGTAIAVATLAAGGILAEGTRREVRVVQVGTEAAQAGIEVLAVALHPDGFHPREVKLRRGKFLLAVDDRSGLDEIDLQVEVQNGFSLANARVSHRVNHWHALADLAPGTYVLRETGQKDWVCRITIEP
jgi:hypothetical protein